MIIDCISDLHGEFPELLGGDLLIIAGDLTGRDEYIQYTDFFEWLIDQEYRCKIVIAGNHDNKIQQGLDLNFKDENIHYLEDSGMQFEGLKIWGAPWSLWFQGINPHCKAFTGSEADLKKKYDLIPDDIDILITHGPPYGIHDAINKRRFSGKSQEIEYVGSKSLLDTLDRVKAKLLVYGHIHEHGGKQLILKKPGFGDENNILCINGSIMNEDYDLVNKAIRVKL
jgi:Icc-related predicted phosphoesterase